MEKTVPESKAPELDVIAMAKAFGKLRARCKELGDQFISDRVIVSTRFEELQTREEEIRRREKVLEEKESSFESAVEAKQDKLDAIEDAITEKLLEFEEGKEHLKSLNLSICEVDELIRVKNMECDLIENRVKEGNSNLIRVEKRVEEMELKLKGFNLVKKEMEDWNCKVKLKESEFEGLCEKVRLAEKLLEPNVEELGVIANRVDELLSEVKRRERELESKERCVDLKGKELELVESRVNECLNEAQTKVREVESRERGVELKEKEVELAERRANERLDEARRKEREAEARERRVESKVREVESTDMKVKERLSKAELKEKHFCAMEKLIEENKRGLDLLMKTSDERERKLESLQKSVEERERNLELASNELKGKQMELQQQAEALALKWAQFDTQVKIQQSVYMPTAYSVIIPLSVTNSISSVVKADEPVSSLSKDGARFLSSNFQRNATRAEGYVPGVLNDNLSGNNFIRSELAASLRLVQDPAQIVLNNMQKSLAQYLTSGYLEESIMSGALSILKELVSMSPDVGCHVKVDATYLAAQWKTKMRGNADNSMESLAFVLFIAIYGLVDMLNVDEIVKLLVLISRNKRALDLCQTHAIAVKIADLVRYLIEKKQLPEAVGCICQFKLTDMLPLEPLLEEYVQAAIKFFDAVRGFRVTPDEKVKVVNSQIADVRALVQFLKDYNLGCENPSNAIQIQIVQLESVEEHWRCMLPSLCPSTVEQHESRKRKKA